MKYSPAVFSAVRDDRLAKLRHVDVVLDAARDASAGTALDIEISGDAIYIDANPADGNARLFIQSSGNEAGEVPLYVSPGAIFNVPFTKLRIENDAQAGKKIRIVYGVGVEFQPGSVAQLTLAGDVALDAATLAALEYVSVRPEAPTGSWAISAAYAGGATNIFTAAANVNGAILLDASLSSYNSGAATQSILAAKATAPASFSDGEILLSFNTGAGSMQVPAHLQTPKYIAPGLGLWLYANSDSGFSPVKSARWKLL